MVLMLVPLVALVAALLLGGRLTTLTELRIRWGGAALLALGAQALLVRIPGTDPNPWLGAALLASYGLLLLFLCANRALLGIKLALVGTLLNVVVITANGGFMPIAPETVAQVSDHPPALVVGQRLPRGKDVLLPPDRAVLPGLGDTLVMRWPVQQALSIGDLALAGGVGVLIFTGMRPRLRRRPRGPLPLRPRRAPLAEGFSAEDRPCSSAIGDSAPAE